MRCVLCELFESLLALEWCKSWGVAGVKAASPVGLDEKFKSSAPPGALTSGEDASGAGETRYEERGIRGIRIRIRGFLMLL